MIDPFSPRVGGIISADIAVPEHEREVNFYSRVLTTGADPLWREDLMNTRGMPVIGLGARSPEYAELPLQWMPHIQVDDVAASAQRALQLGGTELMHGKDGDGASQWAVLLDPQGAAFGIIPVASVAAPSPSEGPSSSEPARATGSISWIDLTVEDAAATCDFYCAVIGWTVQEVETSGAGQGDTDFILLGDDGQAAAGIHHARGDREGLPSVWLIHLSVGDLAESLRRVKEKGGKVIHAMPKASSRWDGTVIQDPVGAYFGLR
jgi:uncharacterized protein